MGSGTIKSVYINTNEWALFTWGFSLKVPSIHRLSGFVHYTSNYNQDSTDDKTCAPQYVQLISMELWFWFYFSLNFFELKVLKISVENNQLVHHIHSSIQLSAVNIARRKFIANFTCMTLRKWITFWVNLKFCKAVKRVDIKWHKNSNKLHRMRAGWVIQNSWLQKWFVKGDTSLRSTRSK